VRVPKSWGIDKARKWVDKNGWESTYRGKSPFTQTPNFYRFRQIPPKSSKSDYSIKTLPNKVQLAIRY